MLVACTNEAWRNDPTVAAAHSARQSDSGVDYDCVERAAVAALNPEICRLAGIAIDDMCLQAVYEAAGDPAICDRIYLQGVVSNCRAYYAQRASPSKGPIETFEIPTSTQPSSPTFSPSPGATLTPEPARTASPTPLYTLHLSSSVQEIFPPIDISHNPPLIARSDETVQLFFNFANTFCLRFPIGCIPEGRMFYTYGEAEEFQSLPLADEIVDEMESLVARMTGSGCPRITNPGLVRLRCGNGPPN